MKNNITKLIIFLIIIILIIAGIRFFCNKQEEERLCPVNESFVIKEAVNKQNIIATVNEVTNEIFVNQNSEVNEVTVDKGADFIATGKWQKFEFNTPVGKDGKYEVYAEKAVQARGFSGASAHIYYLREGEVYYHNQDGNDINLASGITDLKIQGEDIIAVKGENAKIYVENKYIQYK